MSSGHRATRASGADVATKVAVEIDLTIPDNEALTALATLRRLGVDLGGLERGDVWRFSVENRAIDVLVDTVRGLETVYNPNKHALRVRRVAAPQAGEVWITDPAESFGPPPIRIANRELPGVRAVERFVAWRLLDRHGAPAQGEVVDRAVETLLCNPAFQKAIR